MPDVETDDAISGFEVETTIGFNGREDRARIFSEHRGVITPLFENDNFEIDWWRDEDGGTHESEPDSDDVVVAVRGTVPVGALTVKGTRRSNDAPSGVVSKSEDLSGAWD